MTETSVTTAGTTSASDTTANPSETAATQGTASATATTAVTAAISEPKESPIPGLIGSVLTGDSFPAHAIRIGILSSILIAISTFLFKRENSEEEDQNEK